MGIPAFVQIRRYQYPLTVEDNLTYLDENGEQQGALGKTNEENLTMVIVSGMAPQAERQIVVHEIVHAMLRAGGLYKQGHDEVLVDVMAYGILELILDNPLLIDYIREAFPPCASLSL